MSQYKIEAGTGQHIGDRDEQQDRVAVFSSTRAPGYMMAVVADGMGGRTGGAIAAQQVIHTAKSLFDAFSPSIEDVDTLLQTIAAETHTVIKLSAATSENEPHSTMVVLVLTPDRKAIWAHIGDSRLYRFENGDFVERTVDHSLVEQLISEGKITRAEAKNHRLSNVLVKVLGSSRSEPDITIGRCEVMEKKGLNGFVHHQLPEAIINLKQGAGRLIRDEGDRGVLMICDPRIITKPYGRRIWQSLPPFKRTRELKTAQAFFSQMAAEQDEAGA